MENIKLKIYEYLRQQKAPVLLGDVCRLPVCAGHKRQEVAMVLQQLASEGQAFRSLRDGKAYYSCDPTQGEARMPVQENIRNIGNALNAILSSRGAAAQTEQDEDDNVTEPIDFSALTFQQGKRFSNDKYSVAIPDGFRLLPGAEGRDFIAYLPARSNQDDYMASPVIIMAGQEQELETEIVYPETGEAVACMSLWNMAKVLTGNGLAARMPLVRGFHQATTGGAMIQQELPVGANYHALLAMGKKARQMLIDFHMLPRDQFDDAASFVLAWLNTFEEKNQPTLWELDRPSFLPLTDQGIFIWERHMQKRLDDYAWRANAKIAAMATECGARLNLGLEYSAAELESSCRAVMRDKLAQVEELIDKAVSLLEKGKRQGADARMLQSLYSRASVLLEQLKGDMTLDDKKLTEISLRRDELTRRMKDAADPSKRIAEDVSGMVEAVRAVTGRDKGASGKARLVPDPASVTLNEFMETLHCRDGFVEVPDGFAILQDVDGHACICYQPDPDNEDDYKHAPIVLYPGKEEEHGLKMHTPAAAVLTAESTMWQMAAAMQDQGLVRQEPVVTAFACESGGGALIHTQPEPGTDSFVITLCGDERQQQYLLVFNGLPQERLPAAKDLAVRWMKTFYAAGFHKIDELDDNQFLPLTEANITSWGVRAIWANEEAMLSLAAETELIRSRYAWEKLQGQCDTAALKNKLQDLCSRYVQKREALLEQAAAMIRKAEESGEDEAQVKKLTAKATLLLDRLDAQAEAGGVKVQAQSERREALERGLKPRHIREKEEQKHRERIRQTANDAMKRVYGEALEKTRSALQLQRADENARALKAAMESTIRKKQEETNTMNAELGKLGVFAMGRKKELRRAIEENEHACTQLQRLLPLVREGDDTLLTRIICAMCARTGRSVTPTDCCTLDGGLDVGRTAGVMQEQAQKGILESKAKDGTLFALAAYPEGYTYAAAPAEQKVRQAALREMIGVLGLEISGEVTEETVREALYQKMLDGSSKP